MPIARKRSDLPRAPNDHFDGDRFFNPEPIVHGRGAIWRWLANRDSTPWERPGEPAAQVQPPKYADAPQVTWIGHATVLVQLPGCNLITDPVYSERASPSQRQGPRRYHPPAVAFDDLPPIDAVLISHAHYDHLDTATLARLIRRDDPLLVAGCGLADFLRGLGARRVAALDWWESICLDEGWQVTATPARHWSRRGLFDRNRSLWVGFWLEGAGCRLYFAGDSGMGDHFGDIRQRLGAPALALLPIGAYEPRWFMAPQHMNPADAVAAHQALHATLSVGIHFATFKLTDEGRFAPVAALAAARAEVGVAADAFIAPDFGQTIAVPKVSS